MKFIYESELMKNQKHAEVMAPDVAFEALQSSDGSALFFSIGTDHVFYVTREVSSSGTGWTKVDLSSQLSPAKGAVITKAFAVAQDPQTLAFDLALVARINGADSLWLSLGNAGDSNTWAKGVAWTVVPFDATDIAAPSPLTIADVYLMQIPASGGADPVQNCFVDILRTSDNSLSLLDRYYIQPASRTHWNRHALPADLSAGSIYSCLGNRTDDYVPGIYTFGKIKDTVELLFTPQYNAFNHKLPPQASRLTLPTGASAIASALNSDGVTNLIVSASDGLYIFSPDNQDEQATPTKVISSNVVAGASSLAAATTGASGHTAVWGLNPQGALFYAYCPAGQEATASSWSVPVPLLTGVEGFAFYLNLNAGNNVLFAHTSREGSNQLIQLTQDPLTTTWSQRSILLPATSVDDVIEYNSFTTHIQVNDDNGSAMPDASVRLTAVSPVSVYINNTYYLLNPAVPLNLTADATGTITVIQETQSISAVHLRIAMPESTTVFDDINPAANAMQTLSTIETGTDLSNVQITTLDGATQPLVPSSVSSEDRNVAASSIAQLVKVAASLPSDGSTAAPALSSAATGKRSSVTASAAQTLEKPQSKVQDSDPLLSFAAAISMNAGDLFGWLKNAVEEADSWAIQEVDSAYHFLVKFGNDVYRALLNSIPAVLHGVEFVLNKIEVAFEDAIAWLGFIFNWDDILRTHKVLKCVFKQYARKAISKLATLDADIGNLFTDLENNVNQWSNITDPDQQQAPVSSQLSKPLSGMGSPQSHWALYHAMTNIDSANSPYSEPAHGPDDSNLLPDAASIVTQEFNDIKTAYDQIKSQVADVFSTLTLGQIAQRLSGIIADLILKTAKNALITLVDVLKVVTSEILDMLDAPLSIPILSSIYKSITGDDLSVLDLGCLIAAIPATVVYKIAEKEAPFKDDSFAQSLEDAPDFDAMLDLLTGSTTIASTTQLRAVSKSYNIRAAKVEEDTSVIPATVRKVFGITCGACSVGVASCLFSKTLNNDKWTCKCLPYLLVVFYIGYMLPGIPAAVDSPKAWYTIINDIVNPSKVIRMIVEAVKSPVEGSVFVEANATKWKHRLQIAETVLNLVQLPANIARVVVEEDKSARLENSGDLANSVGGFLAFGHYLTSGGAIPRVTLPPLTEEEALEVEVVISGTQAVLAIGCGVLQSVGPFE